MEIMLLAAAVDEKSSWIYKVAVELHCLPMLVAIDAAGMHSPLSLVPIYLPLSACFLVFWHDTWLMRFCFDNDVQQWYQMLKTQKIVSMYWSSMVMVVVM